MEAEGRAPREKDKFVCKFDAIIRRSIGAGRPDFVDETGHGMQQIGARDDADHLVIFDDRQPLDMVAFPSRALRCAHRPLSDAVPSHTSL